MAYHQVVVENTCSICTENMTDNVVVTECGHMFHRKCLESAIKIKGDCPICRRSLVPPRVEPEMPPASAPPAPQPRPRVFEGCFGGIPSRTDQMSDFYARLTRLNDPPRVESEIPPATILSAPPAPRDQISAFYSRLARLNDPPAAQTTPIDVRSLNVTPPVRRGMILNIINGISTDIQKNTNLKGLLQPTDKFDGEFIVRLAHMYNHDHYRCEMLTLISRYYILGKCPPILREFSVDHYRLQALKIIMEKRDIHSNAQDTIAILKCFDADAYRVQIFDAINYTNKDSEIHDLLTCFDADFYRQQGLQKILKYATTFNEMIACLKCYDSDYYMYACFTFMIPSCPVHAYNELVTILDVFSSDSYKHKVIERLKDHMMIKTFDESHISHIPPDCAEMLGLPKDIFPSVSAKVGNIGGVDLGNICAFGNSTITGDFDGYIDGAHVVIKNDIVSVTRN